VIVVRLMGGMGNQLFQFAAGRRLASRHGSELLLDLGWFRHEGKSVATPRSFQLGGFEVAAGLTELQPRVLAGWERKRRWSLSSRRRLEVIRQRDSDAALDERVLGAPDDVLLLGYWQSEKYFVDAADVVRRELRFPDEPDERYAHVDEIARNPSAVAVHVRRGDYVAHPETSAVHGALGRDYYRRALELVAARVEDSQFLAFSDEPEWVERELAPEFRLMVVTGGDAHQELRLMSRCTHHVIANSSFSWWGAWLGEQNDSVVVAPARWFSDPGVDTSSVIPERWVRL
jgi:hypothetical protein